ncbi:hypothetical protein PALA111701_07505 [Paenibacillus lactis]
MSIAWQNTVYIHPPHAEFFLDYGMGPVTKPIIQGYCND